MQEPPSVEALESVHTFPGPYLIKAFGPNTQAFHDATRDAVLSVVVDEAQLSAEVRPSGQGTYVCISLTFQAGHASQVQAAYVELMSVDGMRMLL